MSKQNSVDWLINCITEDQMVKSKSLYEWLEIFEQAKAMSKKEREEQVKQILGAGQEYWWKTSDASITIGELSEKIKGGDNE